MSGGWELLESSSELFEVASQAHRSKGAEEWPRAPLLVGWGNCLLTEWGRALMSARVLGRILKSVSPRRIPTSVIPKVRVPVIDTPVEILGKPYAPNTAAV